MGKDRWGVEGPPGEAYSRVTNPERFGPLHETAVKVLERLELEFDVERAERDGLDAELEQGYVLARSSIKLLPRKAAAAPLVVAFSAFPGLHVRFGHWCVMAFPSCGCDACDENLEEEVERLRSHIDDLTAGRFRERISIHANEDAWRESEFGSAGERFSRQSSRLDPGRARQLIAEGQLLHDWAPWPCRT